MYGSLLRLSTSDTKEDLLNIRNKKLKPDFKKEELTLTRVEENNDNTQKEVELVKPTSGKLPHVYKRRYWVLGLFIYTSILTPAVWGAFGSVMTPAEFSFRWDSSQIALLELGGALCSVVWLVPLSWLTETYGLRKAMLIANVLLISAAALRCISVNDAAYIYLANAGSILTGIGDCFLMSLPTMLSSTWFPVKERATTTAVGSLASHLAVTGIYLSPLIVREPGKEEEDGLTRQDVKIDILHVMYICFQWVSYVLLGVSSFGIIPLLFVKVTYKRLDLDL